MQQSLAGLVDKAIVSWKDTQASTLRQLSENYPTQVLLIAFITFWTFQIEDCVIGKKNLKDVEKFIIKLLSKMAEEVLTKLPVLIRKRY